jgi:tetratricopeptide (TPR) repeat protein
VLKDDEIYYLIAFNDNVPKPLMWPQPASGSDGNLYFSAMTTEKLQMANLTEFGEIDGLLFSSRTLMAKYVAVDLLTFCIEKLPNELQTPAFISDLHRHRSEFTDRLDFTDISERDFNELVRLNPRAPQALVDRGKFFWRQGEYGRGVRDFEAASSLEPENAQFLELIADAWREIGDVGQAREALEACTALSPSNKADVEYKLGEIMDELEDELEAIKHYDVALMLFERDGNTRMIRKTYSRLGQSRVGLVFARRGEVLLELTDLQGAAHAYSLAIEVDPENATHHQRLAVVLARLGRMDEA